MSRYKKMLSRHMMRENPSAESAWQRGTFSEKQCFYPDKWHASSVVQ